MNCKINKYVHKDIVVKLKKSIKNASGNELFLVGKLDTNKIVKNVEVFAKGNKSLVSAIFQVADHGDVVIHNHPTGNLEPSDADVYVASKFGSAGVGFYIVDNTAEMINVVVKAFDKKNYKHIKQEELESFFQPGGRFSKNLKDYELRQPQLEMLTTVVSSFNENKISLIEAGTGTGKSLTYLLPAAFWSVNNKERVVISTNTINLQEQLIKKDIPILRNSLHVKFKSVLVKGRNNYACLRKIDSLRDAGQLLIESVENDQLIQIIEWSTKTREGCKDDVGFAIHNELWDMIQCENDQCLRAKCKFFAKCFFYNSRRDATNADLLIVNHHLLVADIALRKAMDDYTTTTILPPFKRLIIDEAHNIEDVFTSSFGVRISSYRVVKVLHRLQSTKVRSKGIFSFLKFTMQKFQHIISLDLVNEVNIMVDEELIPGLGELYSHVRDMFSLMADDVVLNFNLKISHNDEARIRITKEIALNSLWNEKLVKNVQDLARAIRRFTSNLKGLLVKIETAGEKAALKLASVHLDISSCFNRLETVTRDIGVFVDIAEDRDFSLCRWIEIKAVRNIKTISFCYAPVDISSDMKTYVYDKFNTIVMTSATLSVNKKFDFFKKRIGLTSIDPSMLNEHSLESPFDYEKQSLLCVPSDIADPKETGYSEVLKDLIPLSITISKGKALVLFTSYSLMNEIYSSLKYSISAMGYTCMKQGDTPRHKLLDSFIKDKSSVLFATDSFWQGVDVKGESLECVVVTKLPFRVPSEPIVQARAEFIEKRGGNSFYDYSLPLAVIKFKQGFGRLIRSKSDKGSVLIFDKRVVTKNYGRAFINSLPKVRVVSGKSETVFNEMRRFCQVD